MFEELQAFVPFSILGMAASPPSSLIVIEPQRLGLWPHSENLTLNPTLDPTPTLALSLSLNLSLILGLVAAKFAAYKEHRFGL